LICMDVDGTLVGSSGTVVPEVWEAAERVRASGVRLAICSGRPAFGTTREYAARLDPDGWHIFQNGASVVHLPSGRTMSARLEADLVARLVARARRKEQTLELYSDRDYVVERDTAWSRAHADLLGVPFAPRRFESLQDAAVRAQWLVTPAEMEALLAEPHEGMELSPSTTPVMPETMFVNVTPTGVDKGSAVRALARVMFVGDGHNDMAAMRAVGFPVAMGNAEPAVIEISRREVGHVDAGGLLEALALATSGAEV